MPTLDHDFNCASIDIGSHTVRLLIANCSAQRIRPLHVERSITRLAHGFQGQQDLDPERMRHSIEVLTKYVSLLQRYQVAAVTCGATGVVRRAANGADFLQAIEQSTGLHPVILTEETEAVLSAKGILSGLKAPQGLILTFDLGGGSTEFLLLDPAQPRPLWSTSVFIGAATLTAQHLTADPPPPSAMLAATASVNAALRSTWLELDALLAAEKASTALSRVVATAGTATTLAAMYLQLAHYQPQRINGLVLSTEWVAELVERLARLPLAARRKLPGLEQGREDIILGGALIVHEILRNLQQPRFTITDAGLLEGLLLQRVEQEYHLSETLLTPLTWQWEKS